MMEYKNSEKRNNKKLLQKIISVNGTKLRPTIKKTKKYVIIFA